MNLHGSGYKYPTAFYRLHVFGIEEDYVETSPISETEDTPEENEESGIRIPHIAENSTFPEKKQLAQL